MRASDESPRDIGDLIRFGTIASVDLAAGRCTVAAGDLVSGPVRWIEGAAGNTRTWSPPNVGEQVLLICAEGELAAGVALRGLNSNAHPAPAGDACPMILFEDGTALRYDPAAHALSITVAAGGTLRIEASGGIELAADVAVIGTLTASQDVVAGNVRLKTHKHGLVRAGTDPSGAPL